MQQTSSANSSSLNLHIASYVTLFAGADPGGEGPGGPENLPREEIPLDLPPPPPPFKIPGSAPALLRKILAPPRLSAQAVMNRVEEKEQAGYLGA